MKIINIITDIYSMLNRNVVYEKATDVDSILEIRLCLETWKKITTVAEATQKSYSWVVRYALFRLIKRKNAKNFIMNDLNINKYFELNNEARKKGKVKNMHRHKLCLYGEDELFIRITAAQMNFSMTHLVRLALEWNLNDVLKVALSMNKSRLSAESFFDSAWYWLGIKHYCDVEIPNNSRENYRWSLSAFPLLSYW